MIRIPRSKVVYSFSPKHSPAAYAKPGEVVVFETIDALGGQIKSENTSLESLDWTKVNPATGPLYVEGAEAGDTLVVDILDISTEEQAVILVVPGYGALHDKKFNPKVKLLQRRRDYLLFNNIEIPVKPMIGVIGVAPPEGEVPTGSLGAHGGNMDVALITRGTKLYLPVFVKGALLAIGDLHLVQGDGELCVSAAEVSGEVMVRVDVVKGKRPRYPVLELEDRYAILAFGKTLDEAAYRATEEAVEALKRAHNLNFEEAYMLASLIVNLRINQVVDPLKGVRAEIPKKYIDIDNILVETKQS
ncbi:MAG: formamidase [Thermoprotei archaeon]|nr:MAG: formamidase [Thermoprotei archaeon]